MPTADSPVRSGLTHSAAIWRVTRVCLMIAFGRSARRVLTGRVLDPDRPQLGGWDRDGIGLFLRATEAQAATLRPAVRLEQFSRFGNRLMVELTAVTIAAYRVMLDLGVSRKEASRSVGDVGWDFYSAMLRLNSLPFRLFFRDPSRRIRATIRLLLRFPFGAAGRPGYEVSVWSDAGNIHTHFTHCPPQSAVRSIVESHGDRGDLEAFYQSWCQYDWPGADLIAADGVSGHYRRAHTLSRGDAVCDMCWLGEAAPDESGEGKDREGVSPSRAMTGGSRSA
jgi:hypothetical protein